MNEKLISRLVMGALVGLAATGAYAGQIQSSSTSIAREVITTDTQATTSPRVSYRFAGDVDARSQDQTFQVQFTLDSGAEWSLGAATAANIVVSDGVSGVVIPQAAAAAATIGYKVTTMALSTDKKTLYATLTVFKDTSVPTISLIKQPIVTISGSATAAQNPSIIKLKTVVGTIAECDVAVKKLGVDVKHFVALSDPTQLATTVTATPDEHLRGGATNTTTLITFPTNVLVKVTKSVGDQKLNIAGGNLNFSGSAFVAGPDANGNFVSNVSNVLANLGQVSLVQNATGYDSNLLDQYLLADATLPGISGIAVAAQGPAQAAGAAGALEVKEVDVKVSASQGFVVGGSLFLDTTATGACTTPIGGTATVAVTAGNAAGPITLIIPTASVNAAFGGTGLNKVHVCYQVPGTTIVPGSSFNVDAATLVKAAAGVDMNEQDNFCKGPLYPLSGSLKIDVRNYANSSRTDGWMSIIRLINNSETRTTDVFGQYIHADGKYGKWGKVATLAPRAVLNMTPSQVDAKLTNAAAHATAANNAGATDTPHNATTGDSPRLRITSENGDTLRVQNYLYNPASENFIEASSSQGVDFTGVASRAPASEGQYQDQDAQVGLNGGN